MIIKLGLIFRKRYADFKRVKYKDQQAKLAAPTKKETLSQEMINSREIRSISSNKSDVLRMALLFILVFVSCIYFYHYYAYPIQYVFRRSSYNELPGSDDDDSTQVIESSSVSGKSKQEKLSINEKLSSLFNATDDGVRKNSSSDLAFDWTKGNPPPPSEEEEEESSDSSKQGNQTVGSTGDEKGKLSSPTIDSSKHENNIQSVQSAGNMRKSDVSSQSVDSSKQGNQTVQSAGNISSSSVDSSKQVNQTVDQSAGNMRGKKKSSSSVDTSKQGRNQTIQLSAGNMQKNISSLSVDDSSKQANQTVRSTGDVKGKMSNSPSVDSSKQVNQSVQSAGKMKRNTSSPSSEYSGKRALTSPDPSADRRRKRLSSQPSVAREGRSKYRRQSKLRSLLESAAMADKTVILSTLNAAWSAAPNSMFDLFLEGFRVGNQTKHLLKHLIVIALDQKAYLRCRALHPYCYTLTTKGADFSGEAVYMTDIYLKMMWRRIDFLRIVLEMGYNFVFTDVDIMWFRNPFLHFYQDADLQVACDYYRFNNASDLNNELNGGFSYVKSNQRTIQFYKFFYASKDKFPDKHDQDVLNIVKFDPVMQKIGVKIMFLDTAYFGGFCEHSKNLDQVITMHANCCIGLDCKVHDIRMLLDDWKRYMAMTSSERRSKPMTWTTPRICGPRPVS